MAAGTFANRHTDLTPRGRVKHSHHAIDPSQPKNLLDGIIIFLFRDEREDSCPSRRFISFQYLLCHCDKRHGYGLGIIILRLACYIVKNITFYIRPSHTTSHLYDSRHNIGIRIYLFERPMLDDSKSQSQQSSAIPLPLYRQEFHTPVPVQRTA